MNKKRELIFGFFLFLIPVVLVTSLAIGVFSLIKDENHSLIAIYILLFIIFATVVFTVIDYIRRKIMVDKPLKEILIATEKMSRGEFDIELTYNHNYHHFDEFDLIKHDLLQMAKELAKSEVLKNDFIANVSHEIKTPLSVIKSYSKAASSSKIDEQTRLAYLKIVEEACGKLSLLITNILKLNKLENQCLKIELSSFNLSEFLIDQIVQFDSLIEDKKIELICDIEENIIIKSEKSYLEIVFSNIINNAIKFNKDGGKLMISLNKVDNQVVAVIKDTGCGMDKETGKHIFDKFYQGDTSHFKEGNGLGLSLVKKVIDVLGASIMVESEVDVGTTFKIIL